MKTRRIDGADIDAAYVQLENVRKAHTYGSQADALQHEYELLHNTLARIAESCPDQQTRKLAMLGIETFNMKLDRV